MHVLGCWNSPYGDWFIKSQVELVKRLDWDGYNMDGFGCWAQCFCPSCTEAYKADTGKEIPATGDVNNSDFRHYLKWRLDRYTRFVYKWTAALKAVKSDFVAAPWTTGPGRGGTGWAHPRPRGLTRCIACSTRPSSSYSGIFPRTKGATSCLHSPAATTAGSPATGPPGSCPIFASRVSSTCSPLAPSAISVK